MGIEELELDISVSESEIVEGQEVNVHPNGGGLVALTAIVEPSVFIGPHAAILGNARVGGNVKLYGSAEISGDAVVFGDVLMAKHAKINGRASVSGKVKIGESACVTDNAIVRGNVTIRGTTQVKDNALVDGEFHLLGNSSIMVSSQLLGRAALTDCIVAVPVSFPTNKDIILNSFQMTGLPQFFITSDAVIIRADKSVFLNGQRYDDEDLMWEDVASEGKNTDQMFMRYHKAMKAMVELV